MDFLANGIGPCDFRIDRATMCDDCRDSRLQRMVWRKLHGKDVFTGIVLVPNEGLERDEWAEMGYPHSGYRLVDPSDIEGARVWLSPGEFVEAMQRYD